ncbi:MAG: ATP-binding protein [Pseudomonadota bacterium]
MKKVVVISGKGGTGKTMVTGALSDLMGKKVIVDCDVDAANLHLLLKPHLKERYAFVGGKKASIDESLCTQCGLCHSLCRFDAVKLDGNVFSIDSLNCEGCGLCFHACPLHAITMKDHVDGEWFISETVYGSFVHAKLGIGEGNSGKLVSLIRQKAEEIAVQEKADWLLIDGPPGIGCPVIAATVNTDLAIVVTEPTLSGIHDFQRVFQLLEQLKIPVKVIINKYDLNTENTQKIEKFCSSKQLGGVLKLPYAKEVPLAIMQGMPITQYASDSPVVRALYNFVVNEI